MQISQLSPPHGLGALRREGQPRGHHACEATEKPATGKGGRPRASSRTHMGTHTASAGGDTDAQSPSNKELLMPLPGRRQQGFINSKHRGAALG